jgi:ferredoxin
MDEAFDIRLERSGRSIRIPANETILERLLDEGVDVAYSCMAGNCGTCRTGVVEGTPDHRDDFLTDEERNSNNVVMICCSRSKTQVLALDL